MPLSVVQHAEHTDTGTSVSVTLSGATGAGHLIVASVLSLGTISGVTDGTTAFTQFPSARKDWTGAFAGVETDWYFLPSSNSGKTSITMNSSSAAFLQIQMWEVSGFTSPTTDGVAFVGPTTNGGSVTDCTGAALTTTAAGFLAAHLGLNAGPVSQNPKTGNAFTSGGDTPGSDGEVSLISSGAGTYTPVWVDATAADSFIGSTVGFKESSGGAVTITPGLGSELLTGRANTLGFAIGMPDQP